jgi:DNA-binding response OmpR family regulator
VSRLLIVEDDPTLLRGLSDNLRGESYAVSTASDGETAYRMARDGGFDLVLLDVMLPKMSGFEVCKRLRDEGCGVAVLMLTARGEEWDRVHGLDLGADDYLTKPFSLRELKARVRALLRRRAPTAVLPDEARFGDVVIDFRRHEVRKQGRELKLTRKELGTLRLLVSRAGEVVSRSQLLDEVWEVQEYPTTRTVDNHVASLRAKLEDDPSSPRHVLTVHGVGYKFAW